MRQNQAGRAHRLHPIWCAERPYRRKARGASIAIFTAIVLASASTPGRAGILDAESCRRHKSEYDTLGASGIREMMAKGPEWAKANLTKERMEQVRRYLTLEEDVRFRCPLGKARPELEAAENEAGATTPLNADETAPAAKALPAAKPARKTQQSAAKTPTEKASAEKPSSVQGSAVAPHPAAATTEPASEPTRKSPR
jgi:hypothetical protein